MPLEFIDLDSPPVVAVTCDNRKVMGKEKIAQKEGLKNQQKIDNMQFRKKKVTKWKSNFEIKKIFGM